MYIHRAYFGLFGAPGLGSGADPEAGEYRPESHDRVRHDRQRRHLGAAGSDEVAAKEQLLCGRDGMEAP